MSDETGGDPQASSGGGKPLSNMTAWIGGATALVVAVTGLIKACEPFAARSPAPAQAAAAAADNAAAAEATGDTATADRAEAGGEDLPGYYEGDGVTLEYKNGLWIETDTSDNTSTRYEDIPADEGQTLAFDRDGGSYIRWPTAGGMLQVSEDKQVTWQDSYTVKPVTEEATN